MSDKNQNTQNPSHDGRGKEGHNAPGNNFKNNPDRAREAAHKGGEHSQGGRREEKEGQ